MADNFFDFLDLNQAGSQEPELIPAKTQARVVMKIQPTDRPYDQEGWLTQSDSGFIYLKSEFTIVSEPYAGRKAFNNIGIGGTTSGHEKSAEINRRFLRGVVESARNIDPDDESDATQKARKPQGWQDFQEIEFAAEIGVEQDKNGNYPPKNKISKALTPQDKNYQRIMNGETIVPAGTDTQKIQGQPAWQQQAPQQQAPQQQAPQQQAPQQQAPQQPQQNQNSGGSIPAWAQ